MPSGSLVFAQYSAILFLKKLCLSKRALSQNGYGFRDTYEAWATCIYMTSKPDHIMMMIAHDICHTCGGTWKKTRKPTEIPNAFPTGGRFKLIIWDEQRARLRRLAQRRRFYEYRKIPSTRQVSPER